MKQKYKVFINDQEIVFQSINTPILAEQHIIPESYSPSELYSEIANNNQRAGYTSVIQTENPEHTFNQFKSFFTLIEAAGGLVRLKHKNGDLLMIFRLGKWDLPKGKIEKGEKSDKAAIREVEEECGIGNLHIIKNLNDTYHMYEYKGQPVIKVTHWYMMITTDEQKPEPQTEEGISKVEWVGIDKLADLMPNSYSSISDLIHSTILHR